MPVVTLTTEWKPDDIYRGILTGMLCSMCPGTTIVENAGNIASFDILHASFVIRNTYKNYPKGTIHIICVHTEAAKGENYLLVKAMDHFFIGTDNGIFSLILNSDPDEVIRIDHKAGSNELEVFAKAASDLIAGKKLSEIGKPVKNISQRIPLRATIDRDSITGSIIFIDSYGNAISNITKDVFSRVFEGKEYRIFILNNKNTTSNIVQKYSDVPVGELLTRFNTLDLLEIAINGANVSELLSLSIGSVVRIDLLKWVKLPDRLF
jgi:S-adenosylmethionine hydrolase